MKRAVTVAIVFMLAGLFLGLILKGGISTSIVEQAEKLFALEFTPAQRDSMLSTLTDQKNYYDTMRTVTLLNSDAPSMLFDPIPPGFQWNRKQSPVRWSAAEKVVRPKDLEDAAESHVARTD
jgi:hypothetical protein